MVSNIRQLLLDYQIDFKNFFTISLVYIVYNITFVNMKQNITEQYHDYINEYYSHQPEAKPTALPRLPNYKQGNVMGNESPINYQTKKTILQMNTSRLIKAFLYWISAYMLINLAIMCIWLMAVAMFDLQSPKFTDTELLIFQWGQVLIGLMSVLIAQEELERRGE